MNEPNYGAGVPADGTYVCTEQGDLGLGLTSISESQIEEGKEKDGGDKAPKLV